MIKNVKSLVLGTAWVLGTSSDIVFAESKPYISFGVGTAFQHDLKEVEWQYYWKWGNSMPILVEIGGGYSFSIANQCCVNVGPEFMHLYARSVTEGPSDEYKVTYYTAGGIGVGIDFNIGPLILCSQLLVGYGKVTARSDTLLPTKNPAWHGLEDTINAVMFRGVIGGGYKLTNNLLLNLHGSYIIPQEEKNKGIVNGSKKHIDNNFWCVICGLRFCLD